MEIKSWEDYFLDLAKTCASRSNCIRAQVGAVIVGDDKKLRLRVITELLRKLNPAMNVVNATELNIIFRPAQDMKPAARYMRNKMQLFRRGRIDVKALQCIFGGIILYVYCAKDLLFSQE